MEQSENEHAEDDSAIGRGIQADSIKPEGKQGNIGDGRAEIELDTWQLDILAAEGNLCICSGRQVGKSTVVAIKAAEFALKNPKKFVLIVSVTEDQSERFISIMTEYIVRKWGRKYLKEALKGKITLKNGSVIRCKPIGTTGFGVLGYTVDLLIADEAAFMPEQVWNALTPMMLTTGGAQILISTPNVSEGYFYKTYTDPDMGFKTFHINAEEVAAARKEPQRSIMLKILNSAKISMSEREYARWYLAVFQDAFLQYYSDLVVAECPKDKRPPVISPGDYYIGVDVARYGGDETTFEIVRMTEQKTLIHVENIFQTHTSLIWTTKKIVELDLRYNFRKIYLDTGGVGAGVHDNLLEIEGVRRKVVDMNAAKKSIEYSAKYGKKDPEKRRILKDDMHANLLRLIEQKKIILLDDDELRVSLKSVLFEVDKDTNKQKIFGSKTHIVEGLIRAAWCAKEKNIRIWIDYI